ncbi:MAG: hypothetical protein DI626_06935 [Micavibrio aeruginosavorus]|uniref:Uncharacterized protein n=1 Tax=Micavibrio aeruginosavorus TaxID=349221 RepID=A0A2W5BWM9_9BACT|nr:MAG: hypothetical protein DI626_06935 [Micavibrio aeruginosavorus]
MMKVEEIIYMYCQGHLFPDPEYYNGRGNSVRDLNSLHLEMIYAGIKTEIGADAAKAFVNMVKNLKNTNAKSFLLELYRLERKNWRYTVPIIKMQVADKPAASPDAKPGDPTQVSPAAPPVKRMTEILNAFTKSGSYFGHDKDITGPFLDSHKAEIERSVLAGDYGGASS